MTRLRLCAPTQKCLVVRLNEQGQRGLVGTVEDPRCGTAPLKTFAILSCEPNAVACQIHDRMPVMLEKKD